jgi:hypothetical protein
MKLLKTTFSLLLLGVSGLLTPITVSAQSGPNLRLSKSELQDKIKGGWAGQTIGVTFGGPYEFRFTGTFIGDYQPLVWNDKSLPKAMKEGPGLYDDIYMDLTFVHVIEKDGIDALIDSFAHAIAGAGYDLWFANQVSRYNLLNGIKAPQSGHPEHNLQADAIDYQIESDYSGLMNPGMPNSASAINDKVGHIMNYGDGWYGGVFVGAMYSTAFATNDIPTVINQALKTIPEQSEFYKCISDVIKWHKQYPADWKLTWFELQKKWADDKVCPQGVFNSFNIDAKINAAYVVLGLLYGNGDYSKTLEIATRAGQDADCNPSTAGGVLGTIIGYNKIPAFWKQGLKDIEDIDFSYTTMSLNDVYAVSYKHALEMIKRNGGSVNDQDVVIKLQTPEKVRFEESFPNVYPQTKGRLPKDADDANLSFEGTGFALLGSANKVQKDSPDYVFEADLFVDGVKMETAKFPTNMRERRHELFWKLNLVKGKHDVKVVVNNPNPAYKLNFGEYVTYSDQPYKSKY